MIRNIASLLAFAALCGCGSTDMMQAPASGSQVPSASPTLAQVSTKTPAVLYFVKTDCGSNGRAIPLVQAIYSANKESGRFYVVMNTDAAGAASWSKEHQASFPIIPDPEKRIIRKYGIEHSQTGILVDKDLKEIKRFLGFGRASLIDLNKSLANGGAPAKVDLSAAPPAGFG